MNENQLPEEVVCAEDLPSMLEAILFVAGEAMSAGDIAEALEISPLEIQSALDTLAARYETMPGGLVLLRMEDKYQLATDKKFHPQIERVFAPLQKQTLSQSMLETLSIIAYKQPVTRLEIEDIRGVKCDYSVAALLQKGMIVPVGRKETLGRPVLYGTTDAFLRAFGIASLDELPEKESMLQQMGETTQTLPLDV